MGDKKTIAAIDVGSNAIRMVIADVEKNGRPNTAGHGRTDGRTDDRPKIVLVKKYRVPIRLGADVFESGKISDKNIKEAVEAFAKFSQVSRKHKVGKNRAVGTSALREAKNQQAFVEIIRRKTGIQIEVIDGDLEAKMIYEAVRSQVDLEKSRSLLIDVGGGSVELTYSDHGQIESCKSFPFGTVRTLDHLKKRHLDEEQLNLVIGDFIRPLSQFVHAQKSAHRIEFAVGTGGNLEALGKLKPRLLNKNSPSEITDAELEQMIQKLRKMSLKDRITKLEMRPDRADVIIPAALVVQATLRQASVHRLLIPYVGLKDGILLSLLQNPPVAKPLIAAEAHVATAHNRR